MRRLLALVTGVGATRCPSAAHALRLCCIALALAGCATPQAPQVMPAKNTEFDVLWPAVSLFPKAPSGALIERCEAFKKASALNECGLRIRTLDHELAQLQDSGFFAEVRSADESLDYAIAITKTRFSPGSVDDLAKAALAGATLMMLPLTLSGEVVVEVMILWRDIPINQLTYEFPFDASLSLLSNPDQVHIELAGKLSARIIEDARASGVFTGPYLAAALQSTNYAQHLVTPERIGVYQRVRPVQQAGPLEGAWLSYIRPDFQFDEYVISVYPVRSPRWPDVQQYLAGELLAVRNEVQLGYEQSLWKSFLFGQEVVTHIATSAGVYAGLSQAVELQNDRDEAMVGRTAVFILEDKVVRLMNVVPAEYAQPPMEEFLSSFLESVSVPGESAFMHELRRQALAAEGE